MFEFISILANIVGYAALMGILLFLVAVSVVYENKRTHAQFKIFGFGFIKAKNENLKKFLNDCRNTEGKTFFFTAPRWFNTYVINIGGVKND